MATYVYENINICSNDVSCFVCGLEFGEENKRPHLQLYIKLSSIGGRFKYISKFKSVFGFNFADKDKRWWFKFAKGNSKQNLEYCVKGGIL